MAAGNESPVDAWTAAAGKSTSSNRCCGGDSFAELVRTGSVVTTFARFTRPALMLRQTDGTLLYSVIDIDGERRTILPEDMLPLPAEVDGVRSCRSSVGLPGEQSATPLAAADYTGRSFADGTLPQIAINSRNKFTKAQGDDDLRDSFASTYNGATPEFPLDAEGADVNLSMTPGTLS